MNVLSLGAFLAALGVVQGAFGAHALKSIGPERLGFWTTATHYHLIAALGMIAVGLAEANRPRAHGAGPCLLLGITLFSGSLYVMALGGPRWLGAVTPFGGIFLILGFLWLGVSTLTPRQRRTNE
jgi:uncharacterized membrane protein YgdD (TMEM256/DUF423 family)